MARREAADLIVVKVAPLGGVRAALGIVAECGLPAVVSSALDTSVGMAAGVALAAALPELPFACGLGTVALLEGDVTRAPAGARGWRAARGPGGCRPRPARPLGGPRRTRRLVARAGGGLPRDPGLHRLTTGLPLPARNTVGA